VSFDLLISSDVAYRLQQEGHQVKIFIGTKTETDVYDGMFEKVKKWEDYTDWADVIVFDYLSFGAHAEKLRKAGKLVIGTSVYSDKLEEDRGFGQSEMKKAGMEILPYRNFTNLAQGISFIKSNPGRYVFKPSGKAQYDKHLLFVGERDDGKDIIEVLETNEEIWRDKVENFILQEHVDGIEVAVGAFFNGKEFLKPININFEHKRLFPADIGPMTGDMGETMFWAETNKLFEQTLQKMAPALKKHGHVGYFDINCIVNEEGIYPLEFTSRFGDPTIDIQIEGFAMPVGEFLFKLASGEDFDIFLENNFQVGVCCFVLPFIAKDKNTVEIYKDFPIFFKDDNFEDEGIHLGDVKKSNGVFRVAGDSGYILVVAGSGETMEDARQLAYARIKNIKLQNMFYRIDIGLRWQKDSLLLERWGYI